MPESQSGVPRHLDEDQVEAILDLGHSMDLLFHAPALTPAAKACRELKVIGLLIEADGGYDGCQAYAPGPGARAVFERLEGELARWQRRRARPWGGGGRPSVDLASMRSAAALTAEAAGRLSWWRGRAFGWLDDLRVAVLRDPIMAGPAAAAVKALRAGISPDGREPTEASPLGRASVALAAWEEVHPCGRAGSPATNRALRAALVEAAMAPDLRSDFLAAWDHVTSLADDGSPRMPAVFPPPGLELAA